MAQSKAPTQAPRNAGTIAVRNPCATEVEMTSTAVGIGAKDARKNALSEAREAAADACEGKSCAAGKTCAYVEKKAVGSVQAIVPPPENAAGGRVPTHTATMTSSGACECG